MLGLLLIALSALAEESGNAIGKYRISAGLQSLYMTGFVSSLGGLVLVIFFVVALPKDLFASGFPGGFVFAAASLPTLIPRIGLELLQAHLTLRAIVAADRSTFGFLRTLTTPLLLVADIVLGYHIGTSQVSGILLIAASIALLYAQHGLQWRGAGFVLFTAINAVATISLYKFDIAHFNSVGAEQGIVILAIVVYFFIGAFYMTRENPFKFVLSPYYILQFLLGGAAHLLGSFAYLFAPASVVVTGKRSASVLWAILTGNYYFGEKRLFTKLFAFSLVLIGTVLLVI